MADLAIAVTKPRFFGVDERGWSADPVDRGQFPAGDVKNVHVVSIAPGFVRGNHYHERQTEFAFIMGSEALVVLMNRLTGEKKEFRLKTSQEPALIKMPPNIIHAIKNVGEETIFLLAYSDMEQDLGSLDQIREVILE